MLGIALSILAGAGFGATAVIVRLSVQHMRPITVTLVSIVAGAVMTLAAASAIDGRGMVGVAAAALPWFLAAGLLNFPAGRLLNFTGVSLAGVSRASLIVGATPLFALVLAVVLGGESVNATTIAGTLAIIGGLALVLSQQ